MSDDIKERLSQTIQKCISSYDAWKESKNGAKERESLQEAMHEIRKVVSRLEIDLAISERDELAHKPIPIPPHRDSRRKGQDDRPLNLERVIAEKGQRSPADYEEDDDQDGFNTQEASGERDHHHQPRSSGDRSGGGNGGSNNKGPRRRRPPSKKMEG